MRKMIRGLSSMLVIVAIGLSWSSLHAETSGETSIKKDETKAMSESGAVSAKPEVPADGTTINVYYFHGTRRCKTCLAIESKARAVIEKAFADEMKAEVITWQAIDTDLKENKHFEKEFDLMFSSVIVTKVKNGKQVEWKNLQKVWELVWDSEAYEEYVQKEVRAYLES